MTNEWTFLDYALWYAKHGFAVHPLRERDKIPILEAWQERATTDLDTVRGWWERWPSANIGCVPALCDPPMVGFDIDPRKGADEAWREMKAIHGEGIEDTWVGETGGGGLHVYFSVGENSVGNCDLPGGVEVHYSTNMVLPPSIHPDTGQRYQWAMGCAPTDRPVSPLPVTLANVISVTIRSKSRSDNAPRVFDAVIPDGQRNVTLTSLAGTYRRKGDDEQTILEKLRIDNRRCVPPLPDKDLERIAHSIARYEAGAPSTGQGADTIIWPDEAIPDEPDYLVDAPPVEDSQEAPPAGGQDDDRPVVVLSNTFQDERMEIYERILLALNAETPTVFQHHGRLVVVQGEAVKVETRDFLRPTIKELSKELLSCLLSERVRFVHRTKSRDGSYRDKPAQPTARDLAEYLARGTWPFPALAGIIEAPTIRPDGTILQEAGYDEVTGLYYWPDSALSVPTISENPSETERTKAIGLLLELLHDFPFARREDDRVPDADEHKANALGAIITPVIRPAIPHSDIPAAVISSPQQGTGKGLLTEVIAVIATGHPPHVMTKPDSDEEFRKKLTGLLLTGASLICLDNVTGTFDSAQLAAAMTCKMWQDRVLGSLDIVRVPMSAIFVVNGVNVVLGGDLPRRCYPIRVDPQCAFPWQREGFLHDPLSPWVQEHRGDFLWAILTLARAWFVAGKPTGNVKPMATFTDWARMVGGILDLAGVRGFLGNLNEFYETADPEQDSWHTFLSEWHALLGSRRYTVGELLPYLEPPNKTTGTPAGELYHVLPTELKKIVESGGNSTQIGRQFAAQNGRTHADGVRLERSKDSHTKSWKWSVAVTAPPQQARLSLDGELENAGDAGDCGWYRLSEKNQCRGGGSSNVLDLSPGAVDTRNHPHHPQTVEVGEDAGII